MIAEELAVMMWGFMTAEFTDKQIQTQLEPQRFCTSLCTINLVAGNSHSALIEQETSGLGSSHALTAGM